MPEAKVQTTVTEFTEAHLKYENQKGGFLTYKTSTGGVEGQAKFAPSDIVELKVVPSSAQFWFTNNIGLPSPNSPNVSVTLDLLPNKGCTIQLDYAPNVSTEVKLPAGCTLTYNEQVTAAKTIRNLVVTVH